MKQERNKRIYAGGRVLESTGCFVPPAIKEALQQWASEEGRTLSNLVLHLLAESVAAEPAAPDGYRRIWLPSGATAMVSAGVTQETLEALDEMCRAALKQITD